MSQYPRRVLTGTWVTWDPGASGAVNRRYFRPGTVADIIPGSRLEAAWGPANLSGVIPAGQRGDESAVDHSAVSN